MAESKTPSKKTAAKASPKQSKQAAPKTEKPKQVSEPLTIAAARKRGKLTPVFSFYAPAGGDAGELAATAFAARLAERAEGKVLLLDGRPLGASEMRLYSQSQGRLFDLVTAIDENEAQGKRRLPTKPGFQKLVEGEHPSTAETPERLRILASPTAFESWLDLNTDSTWEELLALACLQGYTAIVAIVEPSVAVTTQISWLKASELVFVVSDTEIGQLGSARIMTHHLCRGEAAIPVERLVLVVRDQEGSGLGQSPQLLAEVVASREIGAAFALPETQQERIRAANLALPYVQRRDTVEVLDEMTALTGLVLAEAPLPAAPAEEVADDNPFADDDLVFGESYFPWSPSPLTPEQEIEAAVRYGLVRPVRLAGAAVTLFALAFVLGRRSAR